MGSEGVPRGYPASLLDLKERIRQAQARAALAVNRELVLLYGEVGAGIRAGLEPPAPRSDA